LKVQRRAQQRVVQHRRRAAQVGQDRLAAVQIRQQRAGVRDGHRVHVHVDDPRVRIRRLRHLVHVPGRRHPRAQVEQLVHAEVGHQVVHHAAEERPVRPGRRGQLRQRLRGAPPTSRSAAKLCEPPSQKS
jgi:hypothetical protein